MERTLSMVDGVMLLVDASEGPLPQTRFVLRKALERRPAADGRRQQDRPARTRAPQEVLNEIYDLFIDLDANEDQLDFPVLYTNAKLGTATRDQDAAGDGPRPLFDAIVEHVPPPRGDRRRAAADPRRQPRFERLPRAGSRSAASSTAASGLATRSPSASSTTNVQETKVTKLYAFDGLEARRHPGGRSRRHRLPRRDRGHHHRRDHRRRRAPDCDSAGCDRRADGVDDLRRQHVAGGRTRGTVRHVAGSSRIASTASCSATSRSATEPTDTPEQMKVVGRGELQLSILIEMMRREGFELQVSRPDIVTKEIDRADRGAGRGLVIDVPELIIRAPSLRRSASARGMMTRRW